MFGIPLPAWQAHDQLERADSDRISLLHPNDANGPNEANGADIEIALQQLGSNNNSQPTQQPNIEVGVQQPLESNNNNQQPYIEMVVSESNNNNNQQLDMGVQQPLDRNNNNQQPDIEMGVQQLSESNNNNQQDSGIVATDGNGANPGSNAPNGSADSPRSNPDHSKHRGYVQNISTLFAVGHGAILTAVAAMNAPVSSAVRKYILFVSALVSAAIIGALLVKCSKEFSGKRGPRSLGNSLVANRCWLTQRIALFLILIMLSFCLFLASDRLLKLRHH